LHKDGEKYIATHLLNCCGVRGGEVIITDNDKREMDRFTMRECGECYVFDDDRIWHMLTPVAAREGNEYAYRDTVAFDMLGTSEVIHKATAQEGSPSGGNDVTQSLAGQQRGYPTSAYSALGSFRMGWWAPRLPSSGK
jgi:hypothetical protein